MSKFSVFAQGKTHSPSARHTYGSLLAALCLLFALPLAAAEKPTYELIEWTDLMPQEDLDALLNPPEYLNNIADGSAADTLGSSENQALANQQAGDRYQQALVSTRVRPEFAQRKIKIPGYVVPLVFDNDMVVTEFFLVPFFGACIHVPPPPPNQMIYIAYPKGLTLESLQAPFYVEGTVKLQNFSSTDMGSAAYSLDVAKIYPYTE